MSTAIEPSLQFESKEEEKAYHEYWMKNPKRSQVFRLFIEGKNFFEIEKEAHTDLRFILRYITNPFFLKRLEGYLLQVLFNYQVNRILALDETFKFYWDIVMARKTSDQLTVDQASKHLVKLLELKEVSPKVINPKQFNIIMNILKAEPEKLKDMAKEFGFEKLKVSQNERPDSNLKLDKGEGPQDQ